MNTKIKNKIVFIISTFFILYFHSITFAQQKFLLNNKDMEEYELIRQMNTFWPIDTNSLTNDVIEQKWGISENNDYYISYCEFDNVEKAIKGTSFNANSSATPFIFGSPTGEILGDFSWVAIDGSAICFQKYNVGIKIFKPLNINSEDKNNILKISNKILIRIDENISLNIKLKEDKLLEKQISFKSFQKVTEKCDKLLTEEKITHYKTENSKWLITEDSLIIGFRKQWSKQHSIFSIDIAEFSDSFDAQRASEYRSKIAFSPICELDNNESVSAAINDWFTKWSYLELLNYISIVGRKGNLSIHFYYYDKSGIDPKIIYDIVNAIN